MRKKMRKNTANRNNGFRSGRFFSPVQYHLCTSLTKATSPLTANGDSRLFSWSSSISVDSRAVAVDRDSVPSSSETKNQKKKKLSLQMSIAKETRELYIIYGVDAESNKTIEMKDSKRDCSPEQSWYSGICLTVDTWRLSGSRQLHKEPEILTKRFTYIKLITIL